MNVLFTLTTYPPSTGGAQIHQHQLAVHLKAHHQVQVVSHWGANRTDWLLGTTINSPSEPQDYSIDEVNVHCMGFSFGEKIIMSPFVLGYYPTMALGFPLYQPITALIEKQLASYSQKADLIHNVRIGREALSFASYNRARKQGIPFILTPVHHPRWVGRKYNAYNKLYKMADALMALTQAEKEILIGLGVAEKRIHVIGHGPVLETKPFPGQFKEKYHIEGPMVLFLGQHYQYKGYKELVEAAKIIWQKKPETQFVFIGPSVGQSELVFQEIADPRIHRLGTVSLQEKTDALSACTLLCVPSTQESFGGVYAEAWCFEKPVIGCNIPAVSEVIANGTDGFLVSQESTEIADRIIFLLENESEARQMGRAGKRKVEEKYTWSRISENVEKVYKTLI